MSNPNDTITPTDAVDEELDAIFSEDNWKDYQLVGPNPTKAKAALKALIARNLLTELEAIDNNYVYGVIVAALRLRIDELKATTTQKEGEKS